MSGVSIVHGGGLVLIQNNNNNNNNKISFEYEEKQQESRRRGGKESLFPVFLHVFISNTGRWKVKKISFHVWNMFPFLLFLSLSGSNKCQKIYFIKKEY